jgi:hypothetical protein
MRTMDLMSIEEYFGRMDAGARLAKSKKTAA